MFPNAAGFEPDPCGSGDGAAPQGNEKRSDNTATGLERSAKALGENCATAVSAPRAKRLTQQWHKKRDAERFQNPFYCKPL